MRSHSVPTFLAVAVVACSLAVQGRAQDKARGIQPAEGRPVSKRTEAQVPKTGPPTPNYAFENGRWWTGSGYRSRTVYSVDGMLTSRRPNRIDQTFDLRGGFVIPPLAEGHNHWVEPNKVAAYNQCYLADGVFYVRDAGNVPLLVDQFRDQVNLPTSVDWISAMAGFTGPGGHPVEILDQLVQMGILPKEWEPDYDKKGIFIVSSKRDIDDRFSLLLQQNPAFVKAYLLFSNEYQERLQDPNTRGNHRGLDPKLLPHLVRLAHKKGLKVAVHIYSAPDFRNALVAGADAIEHLPGTGYAEANLPLDQLQITAADAEAAAKAHVPVTLTLSWLAALKDEDPKRYDLIRNEVVIRNVLFLRTAGVDLRIGSDNFRRDVIPELKIIRGLGVFTDAELLRMDTEQTAIGIFPNRKIGRLEDGYEANFLVLDRDPSQDLENLHSIRLRVKQGRTLTIPASVVTRPAPDCVAAEP